MPLQEALTTAVELLGRDPATGEQRTLTASQLEVAVLERERPRRKFRRLGGSTLNQLLGQPAGAPARTAPLPDERPTAPPTTLAGGSHEPPGPEHGDQTPE
jgi:proteasome alpha subunit